DGTFQIFATAAELGLLATDNLNALDTAPPVPEPTTLLYTMTALALLWFGRWYRRRTVRQAASCRPDPTSRRSALWLACLLAFALACPAIAQVNVPAGRNAQNETSITVLPINIAIVGYNTNDPASLSGFGVSNAGAAAWLDVGTIPLPA